MSKLSRRTLVTSAAALPALAAPAAASPSCTLPPDLIERFVRVRAWYLENDARESQRSGEIDRQFYAATGVPCKQYHDMDHDDPRREELSAVFTKILKEMQDDDVEEDEQSEADRLCHERWSVAEAMLNHEPQSIVDLAWQAEAWLLADLELLHHNHDHSQSLLGMFFRHIRTLGALPQPDDPFGALTIVASDAANDEGDEEEA